MSSSEQNGRQIRIILGVCSVKAMPDAAMDSLMMLLQERFFDAFIITRAALIPNCRNETIKKAYDHSKSIGQPFTHILFIDDDMTNYDLSHVIKLIEADKPVISALVTMRMPPYRLVNSFHGDSSEDIINYIKNEEIKQTKHVGMAFTLIKREVLEDIVEMTDDGPIWFTTDRDERENFSKELEKKLEEWVNRIDTGIDRTTDYNILNEAVIFGQQAHIGSMLLGEDICFSRKAIRMGHSLYVHCGCIVGHIGQRSFNVRDALKRRVEDEFEKQYEGEKLELASEIVS